MAFTPWPKLSTLGFQAQGDIAGFTLYTDKRNQIVAFAKSPPKEPPSWRQLHHRNRFRAGMAAWSSISQHEREQWERATKTLSLAFNGAALWMWYFTVRDVQTLATIQRQSGLILRTP